MESSEEALHNIIKGAHMGLKHIDIGNSSLRLLWREEMESRIKSADLPDKNPAG